MTNQGAPIKLLHEVAGFTVEVQLKSGDRYRGTLASVEDNMNLWLSEVDHLSPEGEQTQSESVFIRGSNILYISAPKMFANAKLFKNGDDRKEGTKRKIKRTYATVKVRETNYEPE